MNIPQPAPTTSGELLRSLAFPDTVSMNGMKIEAYTSICEPGDRLDCGCRS